MVQIQESIISSETLVIETVIHFALTCFPSDGAVPADVFPVCGYSLISFFSFFSWSTT